MIIAAHNPASALKQRVMTPPLVIIEFVFAKLPQKGTCGQILKLSIMQNYQEVPGNLHHELISFDSTAEDMVNQGSRMSKRVKKLRKKKFVVFISHLPP